MAPETDSSVQVTFRGFSIVGNEVPSINFVILPRSRAYRRWESFSVFLCYATCLLVPFQASFDSSVTYLWVLAYIFDVFFLLDVVLQFFLAYYEKASLVTDKTLIQRKYIKGRFLLDLLTLLPIDLMMFAIQGDMRWHQALSLVRLNRMLRIHRLMKFFDLRENELGSSTSLIRAFYNTAMGSIMVHVFTCVWFTLACGNVGVPESTCDPASWAIQLNTGLDNASLWEKYVFSFYWATATATSTGYGDVHAVTLNEKWFSVVAMLVGIALFFGLILGSMASMLTNLDSKRARYTHHLNVIKDHMKDLEISDTILNRVVAYYDYLWSTNHGVNVIGIFDDLPITFQAELSLSINKKVLEKAPLFSGLGSGLKRMLSLVIRPVFYMPNQLLTKRGEIDHHMYYIHKGKVEIIDENDEDILVTLNEGRLFGEVSLVYNLPRSTSVRAATPCVIFILDRADMNRVIKHYPAVAESLYMAIEHRCDLDKNQSTILEMENDQAQLWFSEKTDTGIKEGMTR